MFSLLIIMGLPNVRASHRSGWCRREPGSAPTHDQRGRVAQLLVAPRRVEALVRMIHLEQCLRCYCHLKIPRFQVVKGPSSWRQRDCSLSRCVFSLRIETQIDLSNWTSDQQAIDGHQGVQKTMNNPLRGFARRCHVATPCNVAAHCSCHGT